MKRLLLIIVFAAIALIASGQEKVKKVLELKNGTSVTGFVMVQEDGSYLLETDAGDVLFYTADEVLRLVDEGAWSSQAYSIKDNVSPSDKNLLKRGGFGLKFAGTGKPLLPQQVTSAFWQDYQKASKGKKTGMWLTIGGGVVVLTGVTLSQTLEVYETGAYYNGHGYTTYDNYYSSPIGSIVATAGAGVAIWGVIKMIKGNIKLGRLAAQYNKDHGYASSLSIDAAPGGIALTYNF